jgi:hypothetical protein
VPESFSSQKNDVDRKEVLHSRRDTGTCQGAARALPPPTVFLLQKSREYSFLKPRHNDFSPLYQAPYRNNHFCTNLKKKNYLLFRRTLSSASLSKPHPYHAFISLQMEGPSQAIAFCRLWTLKEAYVKARGLGIAGIGEKHVHSTLSVPGRGDQLSPGKGSEPKCASIGESRAFFPARHQSRERKRHRALIESNRIESLYSYHGDFFSRRA